VVDLDAALRVALTESVTVIVKPAPACLSWIPVKVRTPFVRPESGGRTGSFASLVIGRPLSVVNWTWPV
jgi:hypothetical protein